MEFLKKLLGDKFKDDMSLEDVNRELSKIKIYTEEDMDGTVSKVQYDKACSEAADYKKKYKSTLTEKEQAELELSEAKEANEKELETYRRESRVASFEKQHLAMGYTPEDANKIANALYDSDTETMFSIQQAHIAKVQKEVQKKKMEETPPPNAGDNDGSSTKKLKEMSLAERTELKRDDPEQYERLRKGEDN